MDEQQVEQNAGQPSRDDIQAEALAMLNGEPDNTPQPEQDPDGIPEDELPPDDDTPDDQRVDQPDDEERDQDEEPDNEDPDQAGDQKKRGPSRWQRAKRSFEKQLAASNERYQSSEQEVERLTVHASQLEDKLESTSQDVTFWKQKAQALREQLEAYNDGPTEAELELEERNRKNADANKASNRVQAAKTRNEVRRMAADFILQANQASATHGGDPKAIFKRWRIECEMADDPAQRPSLADVAKAMRAERVKSRQPTPSERTEASARSNLHANRNAPSTLKGRSGSSQPQFNSVKEEALALLEAEEGL